MDMSGKKCALGLGTFCILTHLAIWVYTYIKFNQKRKKKSQWCPALCDPMDCTPPGSSVCGVVQAGIQEWVDTSFSKGPS